MIITKQNKWASTMRTKGIDGLTQQLQVAASQPITLDKQRNGLWAKLAYAGANVNPAEQLDRDILLTLWQQLQALLEGIHFLDVSGLKRVDSAGVAMLLHFITSSSGVISSRSPASPIGCAL